MCCPGPHALEHQDHCRERGRVVACENPPSRCLFLWVTVFNAHIIPAPGQPLTRPFVPHLRGLSLLYTVELCGVPLDSKPLFVLFSWLPWKL